MPEKQNGAGLKKGKGVPLSEKSVEGALFGFRERVPKQRLPNVFFAGFFHRVARGAAPWDPIVFPAM